MHTTHTHTLHSLQGELPCKVTSSSSTSQKQTVLTLKIRQTTSIHQQKVNKNMYIYKNIKHKIYIIYIQYIHSYSLQYIYICSLNWPKLKAGLLHTKNTILFWDLCWSALVSLHPPLNATKVLESACSFGKKIFKLLGEILQFTVSSSEEKACSKVLS